MSDPRPYPQTEWEEEQQRDATTAVDNAEGAAAHADKTMRDLVEASRDIAANSEAVQKMTRESLIADNKRFRRRNAVLVILLSALLFLNAVDFARDVFVIGPQRNEIENIAVVLQECTTPGPREPTPDDPSTGHKCFDESQSRTGEAIAAIVDADGNGEIDSQEILDAIDRFEVFLNSDSG